MKSPRLMSSTSAKALFAQRNGLLNSLVLNMSQSPIEGFFALAQNDTATVDSTNISDISQRREPSQLPSIADVSIPDKMSEDEH
jgi:hypothetical protein